MSIIDKLLKEIPIPRLAKVRQQFKRPFIEHVEYELLNKLREKNAFSEIRPGQKVAITAGSRGIRNLPLMLKILVGEVKKQGGSPFIVPAMGSHGGATAEGQRDILAGMGINEENVAAPIRATMETVKVGTAEKDLPVYVDRYAYEADGIIVINRIKPHVAFRGPYESGLMKMITIGLGKQKGAEICHELGFGKMAENIPVMAKETLRNVNMILAIGVLENAYHETSKIEALKDEEIEIQEPRLLQEARELTPRIYFDSLDVLIIDEIGKDISGTGFDTNVVGRYHTPFASGDPNITRIAVLDLTQKSHGNANGLGIVDFTTKRVFDKLIFEQTYPNSLTSTVPASVKVPMVLKNDKQAIQAAIRTCNILDKRTVRMVRIKNTNELADLEVSEALLEDVKANPHMEMESSLYSLDFDERGNLIPE